MTRIAKILLAAMIATWPAAPCRSEEAQPVGAMNFWFHSSQAAADFLTENHDGVTAITYAGTRNPAINDSIRKNGLARMAGIGGVFRSEGQPLEAGVETFKKLIDQIVADGADAIYIDEPVGPALIRECGPDCYDPANLTATDKGVRFLVDTINQLADHFHARRPGGQIGVCVGDGGGLRFHAAALAAGLREDFACLEQYGAAHRRPFDDFKKAFPTVKTMLLAYNSRTLCSDNDAAFDSWGFWNLDNFIDWIPGPRGDADWLANARLFAAGNKSFCQRPISQIASPLTWDSQSKDFEATPIDSAMAPPAPFILAGCDYRVVSNGVETRAWTPRACNKPFAVSVGPDKDCRDNGKNACIVHVRARTASGEIGDAQFTRFNIAFDHLPDMKTLDR